MNLDKIEKLVAQIIEEIGEDPKREGLKETPKRVAKSFEKIFEGYTQDPNKYLTTFDGEDYDEMIICKNIDFYSNCEHHMQPFFGQAWIGYIPDKKIIGISKLPRILNTFSRRLQNQERLTMQVADTLQELLQPLGVGVVLEAEHLCMKCRGVEKQNTIMTTSAFRGTFKKKAKTRNEFLRLIK